MTLTLNLALTLPLTTDPNPDPDQVCSAARALGRVLKPGGRALIASIPKETCGVTQVQPLPAPCSSPLQLLTLP